MNLISDIKHFFRGKKQTEKKHFEETNASVSPQIGYYIYSAKATCYWINEEINKGTLKRNGLMGLVNHFVETKRNPHFAEVFDDIDKTLYSIYEYSRKNGFIDAKISFDEFLNHAYSSLSDNES